MVKNIKSITITPETHWDREWYLPFEGYRAKLVLLWDRLLDIIRTNPDYSNFTFDGQSVVIQDYLEVRPEKEDEVKNAIASGKISVGPMYILPDEYLVSGESLIRNFMLGFKISRKYAEVMKCAYIPDPFGHIAQLPQIVAGFDLPSVLFARGFGNAFEDQNLDLEFNWKAPGDAASVIGVHLIKGYGSVAGLSEVKDEHGKYASALRRIESIVGDLANASITGEIVLNNGSDHLFAQPHIPDVVKQWNESYKDKYAELIQADFGSYSQRLLPYKSEMKSYIGELHGGKYQNVLSGVFSARMWIKQENWRVQNLLERYAEPFAAMNFFLTKGAFLFPSGLLWAAWQKLLRNHPHDSICGCSVDEVHDIDMKGRFFQAGEMGLEIFKQNMVELSSFIDIDNQEGERFGFLVVNPLPWERSEITTAKIFIQSSISGDIIVDGLKLMDDDEVEYLYDIKPTTVEPRYNSGELKTYELTFLANNIPAFGYKVFYLYPGEEAEWEEEDLVNTPFTDKNSLENKFYKITINKNGSFNLFDKKNEMEYYNLGILESMGDWGDEYDYSGPKDTQEDLLITSECVNATYELNATPVAATATIRYRLDIPRSLSEEPDRKTRSSEMVNTIFKLSLELPKDDRIVKIAVDWENRSCDHRLRIKFPTGINSEKVYADGHFYVVPRDVKAPNDADWLQKWVPTHHQNKFVLVDDQKRSFAVLNKGLPEYEAKVEEDTSISFAITLLRSIGWLSRGDFATRHGNAGPNLYTPGAQCLGSQHCEMALTTADRSWINSSIYWVSEQFNAPLQVVVPDSINSAYRIMDGILISMDMFKKTVKYTSERQLPSSLSFLSLDNRNITLTAIKKAENDDALILRALNLTDKPQKGQIATYFMLKDVSIVNYNEEPSQQPVKASVVLNNNAIDITLEPFVLATFKISLEK